MGQKLSAAYFMALVEERIRYYGWAQLREETGLTRAEIEQALDIDREHTNRFLVLMAIANYRIVENGRYVNFIDRVEPSGGNESDLDRVESDSTANKDEKTKEVVDETPKEEIGDEVRTGEEPGPDPNTQMA